MSVSDILEKYAAINRDEVDDDFVFFSPNLQEDMGFEEAQTTLRSGEHARSRNIVGDIDTAQKLNPTELDALGDWADGAEDAFVTHHKDLRNKGRLIRDASRKGLAFNQKAVLYFDETTGGEDVLHDVRVNLSPAQARKKLAKHGIEYRTLIPSTVEKEATRVMVFDQGGELSKNISTFVEDTQARGTRYLGGGGFIGGDTRTEARKVYKESLGGYQLGPRGGEFRMSKGGKKVYRKK